MKFTTDKAFTILYVIIIFVYFFISFNEKKDEKVHLGGDNVVYYLLGKSLANGNGYTDTHQVGYKDGKVIYQIPHTHFPPGYPAILSVFMRLFGDDIATAKNVNGLFLLATALALFFLLKDLGVHKNLALVSAIFLLHNYHVLYFSMYMYSEITFMFFFTFLLYAYNKKGEDEQFWKNPYFYLSVFSLGIMYYIKSLTIGVVVGLIAYLLYKKNWKEILAYTSAILIVYIPWKIRLSNLSHTSYLTYLSYKNPYQKELGMMEFGDWFIRMWKNFKRYLSVEIPDGIIPMNPTFNYKDAPPLYNWIIGIIIVVFIIYGLIRLKKQNLFFFLVLSSLFGILLLWPDVWFGKRFFMPLIPIMYGLFLYGIYELFELALIKFKVNAKTKTNLLQAFPFALFLLFIPSIPATNYMLAYAESDVQPKYKNYFQAAKWVKKNTPDSSITACRKPNLFHIYSNKFVTNYPKSVSKEEILESFDQKQVDYVIVESLGFSSTAKYLVPALQKYQGKFKQVYKLTNPDTYVFQYFPEMGYNGEWNGDKKHGKGTFKYMDGSVYTGDWVNNVREGQGEYVWANKMRFNGGWKANMREGKGTLYLQNGNRIETIWVRDTMQGPAVVYSPNGKVTKGRFEKNQFIEQRQ